MTVFVSDAIAGERRIFDPPSPNPAADPAINPAIRDREAWRALSARYRASLAAAGLAVVPLARPEIYQTSQARAVLGVRPGDWHLAIKPPGHLRPFHGLPNVFVCDGARPAAAGRPPFGDPLRMWRMADALLCPDPAAADTLRRAGLSRVVVLPPMHGAGDLPAFQAQLAQLLAQLTAQLA